MKQDNDYASNMTQSIRLFYHPSPDREWLSTLMKNCGVWGLYIENILSCWIVHLPYWSLHYWI